PQIFQKLKESFDGKKGGTHKAPKFPMPGIWSFVLRYHSLTKDEAAKAQLKLTLDKMASGGIYDQIGGSFSRYSVDDSWFAPHFEKMLYDNGQLVSVYSRAFTLYKDAFYKDIVYQTLTFIQRELTNEEGGFYAALDADSEGVEGKFYTWEQQEFNETTGNDAVLMGSWFNVKSEGNWENGRNILHLTSTAEALAAKEGLSVENIQDKIATAQKKLLE